MVFPSPDTPLCCIYLEYIFIVLDFAFPSESEATREVIAGEDKSMRLKQVL